MMNNKRWLLSALMFATTTLRACAGHAITGAALTRAFGLCHADSGPEEPGGRAVTNCPAINRAIQGCFGGGKRRLRPGIRLRERI
jgi:hypothetical protein